MFRNLAFCESRLPVTRSISRDAVIDTASALRRDTTTGALREHGEATYHQPMLLTDERIDAAVAAIVAATTQQLGARLRG